MSSRDASKRPHSIKVPRLYKVAATILRQYRDGRAATSLKNLVYEHQKKHPNVKAIYAILTQCVKHERELNDTFDEVGLCDKEPGLDRFMAEVLIAELVFGKKKLPGDSRPVTTIMKYESELRCLLNSKIAGETVSEITRPRFVRVNNLKVVMDRLWRHLKSDGFTEVTYRRESTDYAQFVEMASNLRATEFMRDYHIDCVLLFAPKTHFYDHPLYLDGSLMLQDKASCLPVAAIDLPTGATVMDACSAPGMKTTQIAASGAAKVYAVERSAKRCETLRKIVEGAGAGSVVQVMNRDFLDLDPSEYVEVEYIVLDPSCSGSGMVNREGESDMSAQRLQSLAAMQARLLRHALSFPNVKKVVYSTCSTSSEENEEVIEAVMSDEAAFEAEMCLPTWTRRGLDTHEKGRCFLRADPELDLCNGFFVAVLKRKSGGCKKRKDGKDKADADGDSCRKNKRRKKPKKKSPGDAEKT